MVAVTVVVVAMPRGFMNNAKKAVNTFVGTGVNERGLTREEQNLCDSYVMTLDQTKRADLIRNTNSNAKEILAYAVQWRDASKAHAKAESTTNWINNLPLPSPAAGGGAKASRKGGSGIANAFGFSKDAKNPATVRYLFDNFPQLAVGFDVVSNHNNCSLPVVLNVIRILYTRFRGRITVSVAELVNLALNGFPVQILGVLYHTDNQKLFLVLSTCTVGTLNTMKSSWKIVPQETMVNFSHFLSQSSWLSICSANAGTNMIVEKGDELGAEVQALRAEVQAIKQGQELICSDLVSVKENQEAFVSALKAQKQAQLEWASSMKQELAMLMAPPGASAGGLLLDSPAVPAPAAQAQAAPAVPAQAVAPLQAVAPAPAAQAQAAPASVAQAQAQAAPASVAQAQAQAQALAQLQDSQGAQAAQAVLAQLQANQDPAQAQALALALAQLQAAPAQDAPVAPVQVAPAQVLPSAQFPVPVAANFFASLRPESNGLSGTDTSANGFDLD